MKVEQLANEYFGNSDHAT